MPSKQIHQIAAANRLAPEDQVLVSTAEGALTRRASLAGLPYRIDKPGAVLRTLADRLGEAASVKDYGAVGDGTGDDSVAFQAALDAHEAVHVPKGRYRLLNEVHVRPRRSLVGAGRDATVIDARGARAFTFHRNEGPYAVEPGGTPDWARSRLGQMTIRMATGGVRVHGHEFMAEGLRFGGGQPSGWCLELEDANECSLREISAGPGGGADDLMANGIRLHATDANRGVNFGDSLLEEISIKLKGAGTTGVLVEHLGDPVVGGDGNPKYFVMNNLLLNRVQVNSAGAPAGSTGVWLKRVMRSTLLNVDVEYVDTAFRVEGVAGGGNAGSVRHVSFVNCYVLNCAVPWVDSNAALAGSVMRCWFSNCNGFSPVGKVGVSRTDPEARAGEGDEVLPASLWLPEPANGGAGVQVRAVNAGQLVVTGDYHDGASPARDSNVKNKTPQRGLGVDITSQNVTRLYRPRGYAADQFARLALGNGEAFQPDALQPPAPLHRVEVADPLYLAPRTAEPPQPIDGMVVYCTTAAALPAGSPWTGPGWYARLGSRWQPGVQQSGRVIDRELNANLDLSPLNFGTVLRANLGSPSAVAINVGSTYTLGSETLPLLAAGDPPAMFWVIRQGTATVRIQAADAGVQVRSPDGAASIQVARQHQLVAVVLRYNAAAQKIEVYANAIPDGEFLHQQKVGWTNASQGTNTDAAPYVVGASRAGELLRISSTDNPSHVAFEPASVPGGLTCATFRVVGVVSPIRVMAKPGSGLTLRRTTGNSTPGNHPVFQAEVGRVLTCYVTASAGIDQPNSIYVEG